MINRHTSSRHDNSRAELSWPVTVISKNTAFQGRVKNLSREGTLLYLQQDIDLWESIRVAIEVPECNDVISTVGQVVRKFALDSSFEHYAWAIGVKFTNISEENLKFFSGNLAPEWQKDYQGPQKPLRAGKDFKKLTIFSGIICMLLISLFFYTHKKTEAITGPGHGVELENKVKLFESRLESLEEERSARRTLEEKLASVTERLLDVQTELSNLKNSNAAIPASDFHEPTGSSKDSSADILSIASMETSTSSATVKTETTPPPGLSRDAVYHVVKKGENLYRIARNYNTNIELLRSSNNLPQNYSIYPGQKLFIQ